MGVDDIGAPCLAQLENRRGEPRNFAPFAVKARAIRPTMGPVERQAIVKFGFVPGFGWARFPNSPVGPGILRVLPLAHSGKAPTVMAGIALRLHYGAGAKAVPAVQRQGMVKNMQNACHGKKAAPSTVKAF